MRICKDGELHVSAPYGTPQRDIQKFIDKNAEWIRHARWNRLTRERAYREFYSQLPIENRYERQFAKEYLDNIIRPMIEHYAEIMGVRPQFIKYRAARSYWGKCYNEQKILVFSLYLQLLSINFTELVVVHEMCHLIEPNHSSRFYALLDKYYPNWQDTRKEFQRLIHDNF